MKTAERRRLNIRATNGDLMIFRWSRSGNDYGHDLCGGPERTGSQSSTRNYLTIIADNCFLKEMTLDDKCKCISARKAPPGSPRIKYCSVLVRTSRIKH
jgi:hypothetical protein